MRTDLKDSEFPELYQNILDLFPDKPWQKRVSDLQHQINENPLAEQWIRQVNVVAYGLVAFDPHGQSSIDFDSWDSIKQAMIFISQVLNIHNVSHPDNARMLLGRIRGAFNNPDDMRGIRFELMVATHLFRQGCSITWSDEHRGNETFDFLVDRPGKASLEVECKTLSADKGQPIAKNIALAFINRLLPKIEQSLPLQGRSMHAISLVFQGRIPRDTIAQENMATAVAEAINRSDNFLNNVCSIQLKAVNLETFREAPEPNTLRQLSNQLLGYEPAYQAIEFLGEARYLALRIQSVVPSKLESAVNDLAKRAIRKQLTRKRPGCLVMRIESHSKASLEKLAKNERNWLAEVATKLLQNPSHTHLAAVVFVSEPSVAVMTNSSETEQSRTYVFTSQQENHSRLGLNDLFG